MEIECLKPAVLTSANWPTYEIKRPEMKERPRPCKPDSVPPASRDSTVISLARVDTRAPRIDGRSSGATITRGYHLAVAGQAARFPCSVLLRAGFAEPPGLPLGSGELLPPRFTLTFRPLVSRPVPEGGLFSVALSVTGDAVSPTPRLAPGALPCGVRTFLPIRFLAKPGGRPSRAWRLEDTPVSRPSPRISEGGRSEAQETSSPS